MTTATPPESASDPRRQRLYRAAIECLREGDYESLSMAQIAASAGEPASLIDHYFDSKEAIARCWYAEHVEALAADMAGLPAGQIADRYRMALDMNLERMRPMRGAMLALFAQSMTSQASASLLDSPPGQELSRAYCRLALGSQDALRESVAQDLGAVLYLFHMLLLVFWLYDRSPRQATTEKLLAFWQEMFKLLRPLFFMPMVPQGIAKLARIVMPERPPGTGSVSAAAQDDAGNGQHENFDIHGQ